MQDFLPSISGACSRRECGPGSFQVHFLEGDEIRALRKLQRECDDSAFVFCSERQGPLSINAVHKIVVRAGQLAGIELSVHPHMLRHGKGHELVSRGIDTRAIQAYFCDMKKLPKEPEAPSATIKSDRQ